MNGIVATYHTLTPIKPGWSAEGTRAGASIYGDEFGAALLSRHKITGNQPALEEPRFLSCTENAAGFACGCSTRVRRAAFGGPCQTASACLGTAAPVSIENSCGPRLLADPGLRPRAVWLSSLVPFRQH
jgi:hypothetical protein